MMWSEQIGREVYVYQNGTLVYKRWVDVNGKKRQPSILLNCNDWPNEWIH